MALHIEKTCEVRNFGDLGRCVPGVGRRCKLLYGVIAWIQMPCCVWRWWIAGITIIYVAG